MWACRNVPVLGNNADLLTEHIYQSALFDYGKSLLTFSH